MSRLDFPGFPGFGFAVHCWIRASTLDFSAPRVDELQGPAAGLSRVRLADFPGFVGFSPLMNREASPPMSRENPTPQFDFRGLSLSVAPLIDWGRDHSLAACKENRFGPSGRTFVF